MVMGHNLCLKGHGFESRCCILDVHDNFHVGLLSKLYCLKGPKINENVGPFKKTCLVKSEEVKQ